MPNSSTETNLSTKRQLPPISPGAQQLLTIAYRRDPRGALALNPALNVALRVTAELATRWNFDEREWKNFLEMEEMPSTLFGFSVALSNLIDRRLTKLLDVRPGVRSSIEIAHAVFLAVGQALASAARKHGTISSGLGPTLKDVLPSLKKNSGRELQHLLVLHYVGNILQDFFDSCQVRLQVPDLPWNTELRLREEDATTIADALFSRLDFECEEMDPETIQSSLRIIFDEYTHDQQTY